MSTRNVYVLFIILSILIAGFLGYRELNAQKTSIDIDKIIIKELSRTDFPTGISYSFNLRNNTGHTIKQNAVYLSFPIKVPNGEQGNHFKVEAVGNKIDIQPNEEVSLTFFCQREDYVNSLDIEHPNLFVKGYFDSVSVGTHFEKSGGVESFSK